MMIPKYRPMSLCREVFCPRVVGQGFNGSGPVVLGRGRRWLSSSLPSTSVYTSTSRRADILSKTNSSWDSLTSFHRQDSRLFFLTSRGFSSSTTSPTEQQPEAGKPQPQSPQPKQQQQEESYYSLFPQTLPKGPPPSGPFSISPRTLRKEYLQLQQKLHPDLLRHQPSPSPSSSSPTLTSSHLSKAYTTLLDPLLRAEYILHLRTSYDPELAPAPSPELLAEVLELREEIEEVAGDRGALERLVKDVDGRIKAEEEDTGMWLEKEQWEDAKAAVGRWRYWRSMLGRLGELEEELEEDQ